ncbi:hypothetical protein [Nocardia arizonensis]|uniref:hypothetical protein n=1 Tax=Nocardia arizonensis TaxID=1141647 RepID=UPI0012E2594B|nr:hypothetical protein [Nocardia arizonensis]
MFFPLGVFLAGPVVPKRPYSSDPKAVLPQSRDEKTGKLLWTCAVTDPVAAAQNARRGTFDVVFISDTEPKPPVEEYGAKVELEGVEVAPRLGGNGEFRFIFYAVFATGFGSAPAGRSPKAA